MQSRIENGSGYRIAEMPIPRADWLVLNEIARDLPTELHCGHESEALDWLEEKGATYAYALSPELHEVMSSVRDGKDISALLLTTEDPEQHIGPTPQDHLRPDENPLYVPDLCRGVLVGAFNLHGFGYTSQQHGVIFNNMVVASSQRNVAHVASSVHALGFHTEDSAFAEGDDGGMSPDVLSLHYFRNHERVSTPISVPRVEDLDSRLIEELFTPQFFIPNSPAQGGSPNETRKKVAAFFGDQSRPSIRFNAALMPFTEAEQGPHAMQIIQEFTEHIDRQATTLVMQPGDMLFINNRQALHAKGKHSWEAPEGQGRWQRRLALTCNLGRIARFAETDRRIVNPDAYKTIFSDAE